VLSLIVHIVLLTVHWEQSFNCFINEDDVSIKSIFEQFVRQSMALPNQPVVVFSQVS
jgi:GR25 family glycosyltransferase involved in LPS biosynthesis